MAAKRPEKWLELKKRHEWAQWLASHHDKEQEVWLLIRKKSSPHEGIYLGEAVEEAIRFGWIDGKMISLDEFGYILRMTPRQAGSSWSKINKERATQLIETNRMEPAGMASVEVAKANGQWEKAYSSKVAPPIPEDLLGALKEATDALANFLSWTNSRQLQLIYWLDQSKRPQTRADRIARIVAAARDNSPLV